MVTLRLHGWLREDETREPTRYGQDETPMNRVENKRTRQRRGGCEKRLRAQTRNLLRCEHSNPMRLRADNGQKSLPRTPEQTHHEENKRTGKDAEHGIDVSVDS